MRSHSTSHRKQLRPAVRLALAVVAVLVVGGPAAAHAAVDEGPNVSVDGPPVLSGLAVAPQGLHQSSPHATITYTLSETADVVLDLARTTKHSRSTIVLTFEATGVSGANTVAMPPDLMRSAHLPAGAYRLIATPTDGSGTHGEPATAPVRMLDR
jgi:hypothetical protein